MATVTTENTAEFSARLTAYCVDMALAVAGYFITLKLFFPAYSPVMNPHARVWTALWIGLFLVYQAFSSCEGRRSVGKALMGLRVVDAEGEPLELGRAMVRSGMYLVSSVMNLGFLWALFDSKGRGWHDMAADSRVISDVPGSPMRTAILRVAACACLAVLGGAWYWNNVMGPRVRLAEHASFSDTGLTEVKVLQKAYFRRHGRYADSVSDLASVSPEPEAFQHGTKVLFEELNITATPTGYRVVGRASDPAKTPVAFTGP